MTELPTQPVANPMDRSRIGTLAVLAALSVCLYAAIARLSWRFAYDSPTTERPIIAVLLLFAAAFLAYVVAIRAARHAPQTRRLFGWIVGPALIVRLMLLFSVPIQEIDIYRYLWDGAVTSRGVSPFRYSPEQVRAVDSASAIDEPLRRLVALRDRQPALAEILARVHFAELPTIYPPVSQAVFVAATLTTPSGASVLARVFVMKAWLVGFDLATLLVVIGLLRLAQKPIGLSVIYAWCPLLVKEMANSGHVDAVPLFLTALAVYLAARLLARHGNPAFGFCHTAAHGTVAAVMLALAVGAKLYPIVLAPLILVVLAKKIGWRHVVIPAAAFGVTTLFVLWPMLPVGNSDHRNSQYLAHRDSAVPELLPSPPTMPSDPGLGLKTFVRHWEMNDFLFLLLVENLKPTAELPADRIAWFSILPEYLREDMATRIESYCNIDPWEAPFVTSRAVMGSVFLVVAMLLAWRAARIADVQALCETAFLTIAWFWLLCPTQNPWYWTWALPLLPFARSRAWLAVSGLTLLYYLRFWLTYHWPDTPVFGTNYVGEVFFDFVVTWIEFAPWFAWLALMAVMKNRSYNRSGRFARRFLRRAC